MTAQHPEIWRLLKEEVKAKARSLKGREPEFFPHPPALPEKCPVGVWGPGVLCWGQASLLRLHGN